VLRDHSPVCPVCNVGVLWPMAKRCWMDQDATWYGSTPQHRRHCVDGTELPPRKGTQQPSPTFRATSIVAKRSPIAATAELVSFIVCDYRVISAISGKADLLLHSSIRIMVVNTLYIITVKSSASGGLRLRPFTGVRP